MTSSIIYAIQSLLVATRSLGNEYGHMVFIILLENGKRDTMVTCPSLFNFIIKNNETFFTLQVVDFLSGKAPLNLTMRLGDHMMLIQLQLSTVNSSSNSKRSRTSNQTSSSGASISRPPTSVSSASSSTSSSTPSASTSMPSGGGPGTGPNQTKGPEVSESYKPKLDTRALTEASKNLTKTLRQLSSEVLTTKCEEVSSKENCNFVPENGIFYNVAPQKMDIIMVWL